MCALRVRLRLRPCAFIPPSFPGPLYFKHRATLIGSVPLRPIPYAAPCALFHRERDRSIMSTVVAVQHVSRAICIIARRLLSGAPPRYLYARHIASNRESRPDIGLAPRSFRLRETWKAGIASTRESFSRRCQPLPRGGSFTSY